MTYRLDPIEKLTQPLQPPAIYPVPSVASGRSELFYLAESDSEVSHENSCCGVRKSGLRDSARPSGIDCFFFQAEDGIRDYKVTGVQTCALPICLSWRLASVLQSAAPRRRTPLGFLTHRC